jgi:hypothetical protein
MVHASRGEEEKAIEWLKRACTEHDTLLPYMRMSILSRNPDSKYLKILKEMGLDY